MLPWPVIGATAVIAATPATVPDMAGAVITAIRATPAIGQVREDIITILNLSIPHPHRLLHRRFGQRSLCYPARKAPCSHSLAQPTERPPRLRTVFRLCRGERSDSNQLFKGSRSRCWRKITIRVQLTARLGQHSALHSGNSRRIGASMYPALLRQRP